MFRTLLFKRVMLFFIVKKVIVIVNTTINAINVLSVNILFRFKSDEKFRLFS